MKKLLKNKIIWSLIIILIIGGGFAYYKFSTAKKPIQYTTEEVMRGKLIQTVTATGAIESADEINLSFKAPGRIISLPYKEGTKVKAGQKLAQIDDSAARAQINQFRANLKAAQADLERVKAGSSNEDIMINEEQVNKAENDLYNLKQEQSIQLKSLKEKTIDSLNNTSFFSQTAIDKIYNYFINSETTNNLQFNNISLQNQIKNEYQSMNLKLANTKKAISELNKITDGTDKVLAVADDARSFLNELNAYLDDCYNLASSIIINSSYSQTTKDGIKSDIAVQQTTVNAGLIALQTNSSNLASNITNYNSQIQSAENNLSIYQAQLNLKKAGPRSFQISAAEAAVSQAYAQLEKASVDLNDYVIKAPIDGKLTKVNNSVGEQVNSSQVVLQMLGDERYEIKVDIAESDITKIKIGDKTTIELDAFGSDHPFSGKVTFIEPAQTIIKDVIYYKATVSFDKDSWSDQIKSGMTANITVITAEKNDVLYIPQRAVKIKESMLGEIAEKYVNVLNNGQEQEKIITVGLRGDNGLVEVLSGLSQGEKVITFKK